MTQDNLTPENEDERTEREAAEAIQNASNMLDRLRLSPEEKEFASHVGGVIIETVTNEYASALMGGSRKRGICMAAAVAYALAAIHKTGWLPSK